MGRQRVADRACHRLATQRDSNPFELAASFLHHVRRLVKQAVQMPGGKTTILKQVLRDEGLPALAKAAPYFSTGAVAAWLRRHKGVCPQATLNRYLHEFRRDGLIYDAGRGWYSSLATPFTLDREPVSSLVQELQRAFPLVEFSCWSTEQVKGAMHHLLKNNQLIPPF